MPPKQLHILVLSNCAFDEFQGSGYVILNTIRCLESMGHRIEKKDNTTLPVFQWLGGRANRYRMALGMAWYILTNRKSASGKDIIWFYGAECFLALWVLNNIIRFKGKTVLHSNGIEMLVDEAMMQGSLQVNRYKKIFQWNMHPLFRYAYNHIDLLLTVSQYNADYALRSLNMPQTKVAMIEPCLHASYFEEDAQPIVQKKPLVMYCGGWLPIKGAHYVQNAMPAFLDTFPAYSLLLVGVGAQFKKEDYFPVHLWPRIEVKSYLRNRKELIECYKMADIFIFPSMADSFGLVVAEAMYCGAAVITGRTGIGYGLEHEKEAIIAEPMNGDTLLKSLLTLATDERLKSGLIREGKLRVVNLHWNQFLHKLDRVLQEKL